VTAEGETPGAMMGKAHGHGHTIAPANFRFACRVFGEASNLGRASKQNGVEQIARLFTSDGY
jgi:hypothetical protein